MKGILHEGQHIFLSHLAHFFLKWGVFETKVEQKSKHKFCVQ